MQHELEAVERGSTGGRFRRGERGCHRTPLQGRRDDRVRRARKEPVVQEFPPCGLQVRLGDPAGLADRPSNDLERGGRLVGGQPREQLDRRPAAEERLDQRLDRHDRPVAGTRVAPRLEVVSCG